MLEESLDFSKFFCVFIQFLKKSIAVCSPSILDRKIEEKFELAKQDKEIKDTVSEVFASILEDNDEDLKDTLTEVFDSVRK